MARMPREPEAFAEQVAEMLRRMQPTDSVELVGPRELIINGRRLDLENLYRLVNHDVERGCEIVEHYLDQLFAGDTMTTQGMSFELVRSRIMPRIQPEAIFDHLTREHVAHVPFVNDTAIVFVIDMPQVTVSITTDQMVRWGVTSDDLDDISRENLQGYSPQLEVQLVESREGGKAAIVAHQDGYDAARLLLTDLFRKLAPELNGDFYVATPARDMFLAMSVGPNDFIDRIRSRIDEDYRRLPYPITKDLFYVTRDGVAGTAAAA